jgi:hypothetical protein
MLAEECAQALAGSGLGRQHLAVDRQIHLAASSSRICSA